MAKITARLILFLAPLAVFAQAPQAFTVCPATVPLSLAACATVSSNELYVAVQNAIAITGSVAVTQSG